MLRYNQIEEIIKYLSTWTLVDRDSDITTVRGCLHHFPTHTDSSIGDLPRCNNPTNHKKSSGHMSTYNTRCGGLFGYGSGSRDTGVALEKQLITLLFIRSRTRPNPHKVIFHMRNVRFRLVCALGKRNRLR